MIRKINLVKSLLPFLNEGFFAPSRKDHGMNQKSWIVAIKKTLSMGILTAVPAFALVLFGPGLSQVLSASQLVSIETGQEQNSFVVQNHTSLEEVVLNDWFFTGNSNQKLNLEIQKQKIAYEASLKIQIIDAKLAGLKGKDLKPVKQDVKCEKKALKDFIKDERKSGSISTLPANPPGFCP
jgi:hypothetical protein